MKQKLFFVMILLLSIMGIRAQSSCTPPTNLSANLHSPNWHNVELSWDAVVDTTSVNLLWANPNTSIANIGTDGPSDFSGIIRFTPTDLVDVAGFSLSSVSFRPSELQTVCTYYVQVWQGGSITNNTTYNPGTLLVEQQVTNTLQTNTINTVLLNTPISIDPTQELWIGIRCNTTAGHPLSASNNETIANKGDILVLDSAWSTLTTEGLMGYNWLIIGTFTDPNNPTITGYNLYKDDILMNTSALTNTTYLDSVSTGTYVYDVTAVYSNGCESDAISKTVTMNAYPCGNCSDTVIIGTGTSTAYNIPINTFYNYSISQQIYTAAELGSIAGGINCIAYQYIFTSTQTKNIQVYIGNTTKSTFSNYSDWIPISDMQFCFDGNVVFGPGTADNWVNIPLSIPFEWDGVSNIVVAIINNTGNYTSGSSPTFRHHTATGSTTLHTQRDSEPYSLNTLNTSLSGSISSNRNNIRFLIGDPITCRIPSALTISEITSESANISWGGHDEDTGYELVCVPSNLDITEGTIVTVTDTFYSLTGLAANTNYTVYLRASCSPDNSNWASTYFHTECLPLEQLPFVENFDNYGSGNAAFPDCWKKNSTVAYPYISNTQHASGTGSLYFYSTTSSHSCAILPRISTDIYPLNTLQVTFKAYKTYDAYGLIQVGVITDPNDISTFTPIKTIDGTMYSGNNTWNDFIVYLNNYTGQDGLIAFVSPSLYTSYVYIDDVEVRTISGCGTPLNFAVSQISGASAYLSWDESDLAEASTIYNIEYSEQGVDNWQIGTPNGTNCMLSGLEPNTTYEVRLFVSCDNGYSDTLTTTFSTNCLLGGDYSVGDGTNTSSYLPFYTFYNYSISQQLYLSSELGGNNTFSGIKFYVKTPASTTRNIDIYLGNTSQSSLTTSTYISTTNQTKVFSGNVTVGSTEGWLEITFDSTFNYTGNNLVITIDDNTGSYVSSPYFAVHAGNSLYEYDDNINFNPTSPGTLMSQAYRNNIILLGNCDSSTTCVAPNIVINNITENSAELTWAPGYQETEWELEYKLTADSIWTSVGTINQPSYTLSNLAAGAEHTARLRAICNPGEYSSYREVSFLTPCTSISTLPLIEEFDSLTTAMPNCWYRLGTATTGYPYITSSQASTAGGKSLYMANGGSNYYAMAITPRFADEIEMDSLHISFYTYGGSTSYRIEVGIMSDPTDASTFTTLSTIYPTIVDTWERHELYTRNYTGDGHYVAFRSPVGTYNTIFLDDININAIAGCPHIENLMVSSIDNSSATFTWEAGSTESSWEVVVLPAGPVDLDTITTINFVYDTTYTELNLTSCTNYSVYVRANCSGGDNSTWERLNFTTTQIPAPLPYMCDFEMSNPEWGFFNNSGNNKWYIGTATNNGGMKSMYISSDNGVTNSYTSNNTNNWAYRDIFFPASTAGYVISFDWKVQGESCCDHLNVHIGNITEITTSNCSQYTSLPGTIRLNTNNMNLQSLFTNFTYTLPGYSTDGVRRLYFVWHNDGSIQNDPPAAIDNIMISAITCPIPTGLTATNITTTTANLSWTENGTATEWIVYYKPSTDTTWNETIAHSTTHQLTGLNPDMSYEVRVASDCGNDTDISPLSNMETFSTLPTCPAPTNLSMTNNTATSIDITWTAGGTETAWVVAYKTSSDDWNTATENNVTTTTHTITGVSSTSSYQIRVKAVCDINDESSWSNIIEVTPGSINFPTTGTMTLTTCGITLFDDGGPTASYSPNCSGVVTINPENAGEFVVISGNYDIENSFDELYVYDGTTTNGTLLNVYTGSGTILDTSITGSITLEFLSDGSVSYPGFQITATCSTVGAGGGTTTDPCDAPTNVQVNEASNSATVTWASTANAWVVEYKLATASNWTASPTLTATTYNITGLTASTNYVVRVKSICDAAESDWSAVVPFTTLAGDVNTYTITASATGPGSITPNGTITVPEGNNITFSFTANEGATTQQLLVDNIETAVPANNEYTFSSVVANHTIEVIFAEETGIEEIDLDAAVLLFPNPATSHIEIRLSNNLLINSTLDIYDVYGRKVATQMMNNTSAMVDISGYSAGMYLVRISNDNGIVVKNFIKK